MAGQRTDLQMVLENTSDIKHVYYSPPSNVHLKFPCIIYQLNGKRTDHADNIKYRNFNRYSVTIISKDPDSDVPNKIENLQYCEFDRFFISDNLNHWVYNLYY